jgi:hypothetical protein
LRASSRHCPAPSAHQYIPSFNNEEIILKYFFIVEERNIATIQKIDHYSFNNKEKT